MIDPSDADQVSSALLDYLRATLRAPDLAYEDPPQPIFGGNRTFVYGFSLQDPPDGAGGPLILRIVRSADEESVSLQAAVQSALRSLGYPVPRMLGWSEDDRLGGDFQIMERIPGSALVLANPPQRMTAGSLITQLLPEFRRLLFGPWPRQLATLHAELHQLDPTAFVEMVGADGISRERLTLKSQLDRLAATARKHALDGLQPGIQWLMDNLPDESHIAVCHGDFFPNQVLMRDGEITGVIDWGDVMLAPPEVDVAIVKAGLETLAPPLGRVGLALQRWLARKFVDAYQRLRPLNPDRMQYGEAYRCLRVLLSVAVRRLAMAGVIDATPGPIPYDNSASERLLISRIRALTDTDAHIPQST